LTELRHVHFCEAVSIFKAKVRELSGCFGYKFISKCFYRCILVCLLYTVRFTEWIKTRLSTRIVRWRQSVTHTWWWVDCQNLTKDDILPRSPVWLLIYWIKCLISLFVIDLTRRSNYALEYTADPALQVTLAIAS